MARINQVTKASVRVLNADGKPRFKCSGCGTEILPGMAYKWAQPGFRSHSRVVKCSACSFRRSELTTSLMAEVYAAIEEAEDNIAGFTWEDGTDALDQELSNVRDARDSVVEQYTAAAEPFGGQGENQERADELEDWDLDISFDEPPEEDEFNPPETEEETDAIQDARDEWWQSQVDAAQEALNSCPL
jgi:DNA-directed RNA polymerase subunit RPC12/RpoP